jgi:UDP-glucose-4-epimerase GalE
VTVVDDLSRGHAQVVDKPHFCQITLSNTDALRHLMSAEKFDAVIHFAAYIAVGESTQKPELYFTNNTGGTLSLLNAMIDTGISRIVFSSTAAVYGNPDQIPITEDMPYKPVNPYGETKVMAEKILYWLDQFRGIRSVSLRYFNACGAAPEANLGEEHNPETHLIPLLLQGVDTGAPVTLFGDDYPTPDGTCIRDYIHVMDLADAHLLALTHLLNAGPTDVFNVGTGAGHSVLEVVRAVEEVTGGKVPLQLGPRREGDPPVLVANPEKLKRKLGWQPTHTNLREIVSSAWEFYKSSKTTAHR